MLSLLFIMMNNVKVYETFMNAFFVVHYDVGTFP